MIEKKTLLKQIWELIVFQASILGCPQRWQPHHGKKNIVLTVFNQKRLNSSDKFWFGQRYRSTFCSSALKRLQRTHPVSCQHHQIHNISTPYPLNVLIKTKAVFQVSLKKSNLPGVSPKKKKHQTACRIFWFLHQAQGIWDDKNRGKGLRYFTSQLGVPYLETPNDERRLDEDSVIRRWWQPEIRVKTHQLREGKVVEMKGSWNPSIYRVKNHHPNGGISEPSTVSCVKQVCVIQGMNKFGPQPISPGCLIDWCLRVATFFWTMQEHSRPPQKLFHDFHWSQGPRAQDRGTVEFTTESVCMVSASKSNTQKNAGTSTKFWGCQETWWFFS